MQPVSSNSARSLPRMRLLNLLSVLADLSSDDSFAHNLGPKCGSECPPYRVIPRSGEIRLPLIILRAMFFKKIANIT